MVERLLNRERLRKHLESLKSEAEERATSLGHTLSWRPIHDGDGVPDTFIPGECALCGDSVTLRKNTIEGDAVSVSCPGKR